MYHITEAEFTLFLLLCIKSMFFFLVESRFPPMRVFCHSAVRAFRTRGFRIGTRASGATLFISSASVIWYIVLFRQNRTDRPLEYFKMAMVSAAAILSISTMTCISFLLLYETAVRAGPPSCAASLQTVMRPAWRAFAGPVLPPGAGPAAQQSPGSVCWHAAGSPAP